MIVAIIIGGLLGMILLAHFRVVLGIVVGVFVVSLAISHPYQALAWLSACFIFAAAILFVRERRER